LRVVAVIHSVGATKGGRKVVDALDLKSDPNIKQPGQLQTHARAHASWPLRVLTTPFLTDCVCVQTWALPTNSFADLAALLGLKEVRTQAIILCSTKRRDVLDIF
jgi:hypothetical protein